MGKPKPETKLCKHCKTEIPYAAKVCPNCKKRVKAGFVKWIIIIAVILLLMIIISSGDSKKNVIKVGTVGENVTSDTKGAVSGGEDSSNTNSDIQTEYYVGDILIDGDMKIVYMASGIYNGYGEFSQLDEGYQYIFLEFAFENQSDTDDDSISFYNFEAYADGYSVDMYYTDDEELSATLSAGRSTSGYIYFTVPVDAQDIEVEYSSDYFTDEKITFIYDGEHDSGYVLEGNSSATEDAFKVGDVIEAGDLTITYLSCEPDESDNQFIQPSDGYHYVTFTFEFENNGDDDEYVSMYDFDCYADGIACKQTYYRDDVLSATISSAHKAKGTVTFEIPDDAGVVEAEYLTNIWTSNRIVFAYSD